MPKTNSLHVEFSSYRNVNILKSWIHKDIVGKRSGSGARLLALHPGSSA